MIEKADSLNNQAIILASDGNFTDAIACFKRAITIDNKNYLLWFNLGVTYRDAGDLEKAADALATAYIISPTNEEVIETYATMCLALKKLNQVTDICYEGLDLNPCNSHLWNLLGVANFQAENYEDAAECFEHAVYINPFYADALYNLADTYNLLKNTAGEAECRLKIKEIGE